jgi:O-antigen ligase
VGWEGRRADRRGAPDLEAALTGGPPGRPADPSEGPAALAPGEAPGTWAGSGGVSRAEALAGRVVLALMAFAVPLDVMPLFEEYSITVAIGGVLALAVAWHVASTGRVRSAPAPILLLAGFAAWAAASLLWAADLAPSVGRLTTVLQLLAFVWLGWQMARSRLDLRLLLAGFLAGCAVVAGGAWRSFLSGVTVVEMVGEQAVDFDDPRYAAIGFDPNDMGVTLAIGIPIAAYLALTGERRWRHLWFAYVPLALSGIALSGSRGAMITSVVAIGCVVTWTGRRSLAAAGATLALVVAGALSVWWLKPETWERALTFRQQIAGGTLGDRLPIWRAAWDVLWDHPVAGVAIGGFPEAVAPVLTFPSAAHNTVLSVLVELGLVGGLLYFGAVVAVLLGVRRSAAPDRELVVGLLLTWTVGASSLTWDCRKTTWLLLLLGTVVGVLGQDEGERLPG